MNLNELRDKAYKTACEHGFHDKELSNEHWLCLVNCELSEAVEADRKERRADKLGFDTAIANAHNGEVRDEWFYYAFNRCIKDTVEDELSDAFIWLLDLFGVREVYLNEDVFSRLTIVEYSVTHKRKSFTESIFHISKFICASSGYIEHSGIIPEMMLLEILGFAEHLGIDLMWHIEQKMKYNQSREKMHGKKY